MKTISSEPKPDMTKNIREEIVRSVGEGNGFYDTCRKKLRDHRQKISPARKQIDELADVMILVGSTLYETPEKKNGIQDNRFFRLYENIKYSGCYRIPKRDFRAMVDRCNNWPAYLSGKIFDLGPFDIERAREEGNTVDEQRHHLFNLFISRGMSPRSARAIILNMNV